MSATQGTQLARVYGRIGDVRQDFTDFYIGDLREGEHGQFTLVLTPWQFSPGAKAGAQAVLTFDAPDTGAREQQVVRVEASYTDDRRQAEQSENAAVMLPAALLDAEEKTEEAVAGLDRARRQEAVTLFERLCEKSRRVALETRDQELLNTAFLLKHFMADLAAVHEAGLMHGHEEARKRIGKDQTTVATSWNTTAAAGHKRGGRIARTDASDSGNWTHSLQVSTFGGSTWCRR